MSCVMSWIQPGRCGSLELGTGAKDDPLSCLRILVVNFWPGLWDGLGRLAREG